MVIFDHDRNVIYTEERFASVIQKIVQFFGEFADFSRRFQVSVSAYELW
jgi:hypothetical protein